MAQLSQPESRRDALATDSHARVRSSLSAPAAPAANDQEESAACSPAPSKHHSIAAHLSVQDWFLAAYFFILSCAVAFGSGEQRNESLKWVGLDVVLFLAALYLTRGGVIRRGSFASNLVYRVALFVAFLASYLQLRFILPTVTARVVDADILAFDLKVFAYEPAMAWDRFVTPSSVEWFAFFYFSYFFLLATHVIPMVLAIATASASRTSVSARSWST